MHVTPEAHAHMLMHSHNPKQQAESPNWHSHHGGCRSSCPHHGNFSTPAWAISSDIVGGGGE